MMRSTVLALLTLSFAVDAALQSSRTFDSKTTHRNFQKPTLQPATVLHAEGTGGWGLGNSRDMIPEEFAKRSGERKVFEAYKLSDRGEFMRQVSAAKDAIKDDELKELLGVAAMAGIKVKNPNERLNKFEDDEVYGEDEYLDLSI
jgi:uncharacterized protein YajQ (UPF0234 family)